MKKKAEYAASFYRHNYYNFRCPVCKEKIIEALPLRCKNNHLFNMAKNGSLYFVNHKIKSDYTKTMLEHRRHILNSTIYGEVIAFLREIINDDSESFVVDAGAGEGSIIANLQLNHCQQIGFDLSKEGIALATDYNKDNLAFAVGDLTDLPLKDSCCDYILNFLSPAMYREFSRILKDTGRLIKVVPETYYLQELRQALYQDSQAEVYDNSEILQHLEEKMEIITSKRLTYTVPVDETLREDLLLMSPLTWHHEEASLQQLKCSEITIDLRIIQASAKKLVNEKK